MDDLRELEAQADEERRQIVGKYAAGRARTDHIDDWEDPGREDYHTTDRYSFIHDCRLPDAKNRTSKERKQMATERSREEKWIEMTVGKKEKYFGDRAKLREKMIDRVHKGVPNSMRGMLWKILLEVDTRKAENEGVYERMREYALLRSSHIRQIDLDVNRTYRDNEMFRERYNSRQQALFYVLAAYSVYNTEVGYCQGMSQIAALLLMYFQEEEEAFWALSQLMAHKKYAMHGFFIQGFPKLLRFQDHHDKVMKKFLPGLKKHMDRQGYDTSLYCLKWFFQCFLDRVPFSLALRVWDLYLLEGECILTAMSYNILKMHRRKLRKFEMDQLSEHIQQNLSKNFEYEDDEVIDRLRDVMYELRSNRLASPGPAPDEEKPQHPFGLEVPQLKDIKRLAATTATTSSSASKSKQELGLRTGFSEKEREVSQQAIRRQMELENELLKQQQQQQQDQSAEYDDDEDVQDGGVTTALSTYNHSRSSSDSVRRHRRQESGKGQSSSGNGDVNFYPAGTSSPRQSSSKKRGGGSKNSRSPGGASSTSEAAGKAATAELDESVRMMLAGAADLNGGGGGDSNLDDSVMNTSATTGNNLANTSYDSVASQASNRSDVVRIRVPYNKEDAVNAKMNASTSAPDKNRIRISVTTTAVNPTPGGGSERRRAAATSLPAGGSHAASHNNSIGSNNDSSMSSSGSKRHSYNAASNTISQQQHQSSQQGSYTSQSLNRKSYKSSSSSKSDKMSTSLEGASVSVSRYERYERTDQSSSSTKRTFNSTTAK